MKQRLVLLLAALGCSTSGSSAVDSVASRDTVMTPAPAPATTPPTAGATQEIYIDTVAPGNPVRVVGRARTFENTVQVRVRDASGDVLSEVFTTSRGEMGHHNPFSADVWLVRDPGQSVTVEAFEYSAMDGSVRSLTSRQLPFTIERTPITLMFPVGGCDETRAFTRTVPKSAALARLLVEALVADADTAEKAAGATSPFPRGSRVRSVLLREGTLTVDFNERLQNVSGACAVTAIRNSVTRTLQLLPSVKRVVITAMGSERLALQP